MDFFTNTYEIELSTHTEKPKGKVPAYEFRAATIKERRAENKVSKWLSDIMENPENDVDDPIEYIEAVLPHIQNRLLFVRVGKKRKAALIDLEETLDYTSIMELYMSMRLQEEMRILDKKKSLSLSNLSSAESANRVPANATGPQDKKAKSSSSHAPDATATAATNATGPDGSS